MSLPFSALPACGMASFPQKQCYYNPWFFQNQPNLALPGFFKGTVTGCVNFLNESMIIIFNVLRILERNTSIDRNSSGNAGNWRRFVKKTSPAGKSAETMLLDLCDFSPFIAIVYGCLSSSRSAV